MPLESINQSITNLISHILYLFITDILIVFMYVYIVIITDVDYADDIALLANTTSQDKTKLHSLERAATGIGHYVNAD